MDIPLDPESEIESKPVKDVPVVQDQATFRHDTDDIYEGFFEAKKKDRSIKMHGPGVYTTAEGDSYSGTWEADRLGGSEDACINFADKSKYEGAFKDWSFSGRGKYTYADSSYLIADFNENAPTGLLTLIDPNDHTWLGRAEQGFGWVEPVNHFYDILEKTRESKVKKHRKNEFRSICTVSKLKSAFNE